MSPSVGDSGGRTKSKIGLENCLTPSTERATIPDCSGIVDDVEAVVSGIPPIAANGSCCGVSGIPPIAASGSWDIIAPRSRPTSEPQEFCQAISSAAVHPAPASISNLPEHLWGVFGEPQIEFPIALEFPAA